MNDARLSANQSDRLAMLSGMTPQQILNILDTVQQQMYRHALPSTHPVVTPLQDVAIEALLASVPGARAYAQQFKADPDAFIAKAAATYAATNANGTGLYFLGLIVSEIGYQLVQLAIQSLTKHPFPGDTPPARADNHQEDKRPNG